MTLARFFDQSFPIAFTLVSVIVGATRYKLFDLPTQIFYYYTCLGFMAESIARFAAVTYGNNMPVYNIYSWFSFGLIALYFNYSVDTLRRYHIGWYIGTIAIILGILNSIYLQPLTTINFHFFYLNAIVTIALSLFAFFRILYLSSDLKLGRLHHFWISLILCTYWTLTIFIWGLYGFFILEYKDWIWLLSKTILTIAALSYVAITLVFWRYPKLKAITTQQSGKELFYETR